MDSNTTFHLNLKVNDFKSEYCEKLQTVEHRKNRILKKRDFKIPKKCYYKYEYCMSFSELRASFDPFYTNEYQFSLVATINGTMTDGELST